MCYVPPFFVNLSCIRTMKQFIRNFRKQKAVGVLNIASLSLGVMVALVVGLWAINELSFDNFHANKEHIYRVVTQVNLSGENTKNGSTFKFLGEIVQDRIPQVKAVCRTMDYWQSDIRVDGRLYPSTNICVVDANFFTLFSFRLKEGDPSTVLAGTRSVVLSESAVKQYFPDKAPMGQAFSIGGNAYTVTGIMEDMPANSSLDMDVLCNIDALPSGWDGSDVFMTFWDIPNAADVPFVTREINDILKDFLEEMTANIEMELLLEPLPEMHFSTGFIGNDVPHKGDKTMTVVFVLVAVVILVIACINFTNLFVSTSFMRARTIGIKKALGGGRGRLVREFYGETALYVLLAVGIGVLLACVALPVFNGYTQSEVGIDPASPRLYLFLGGLFVFTVAVAGTFPACYLTRFDPVETIFGRFRGARVSLFQKALLVLQFAASIALLLVVTLMYRQVDYMISRDLGFDKENVVYVHSRGSFGANFDTFRDEMMRNPVITDVTKKLGLTDEWMQGMNVSKEREGESVLTEICHVWSNYFDFMGLDIVQGENPFYLESRDTIPSVVVNERAVDLLQLGDQPVGQIIYKGSEPVEIKGVVRNAWLYSFHQGIHPQIYVKMRPWESDTYFFKVQGDPQSALATIRQEWERCNPEYPFEYHFLDDTYEQQYRSETNAGRVLAFAMAITLLISVAGLFAMAHYSTQRRRREIALRKVNGATLRDLLLLLNRDFLLWTLAAYVVAVPVSVLFMHRWLQSFAVQAPLAVWVFLLVGVCAFAVTLLTTSVQTWRVACANPVDTLKAE